VQSLWSDAAFAPPAERIAPEDVFALSDDMRRYLREDMAGALRTKGRQQGLIDALYHTAQLRLSYDPSRTRNAAEAFAARSGNCLSLVIMTAAFARELGLQVNYQSAYTDETWSRSGNLYFRSGHVNLSLGPRLIDAGRMQESRTLTIDFLPPEELRGLRTSPISEATVLAMFMNNRAAEALVRGHTDDAYWWARAAMQANPNFLGAWNTLGVVYMRHGDKTLADRAFARVLGTEPGNTQALANRAQVLEQLGRADEARALRERLAKIEPYPPFHFFDLGREAMARGDFKGARALFARELDRAAYQSEFHFWYGLASWRLGDAAEARRHLDLALENSATRGEHDLYAAKLAWLRAQ
jgi:tetratricopeptide (TPR) repeat protein